MHFLNSNMLIRNRQKHCEKLFYLLICYSYSSYSSSSNSSCVSKQQLQAKEQHLHSVNSRLQMVMRHSAAESVQKLSYFIILNDLKQKSLISSNKILQQSHQAKEILYTISFLLTRLQAIKNLSKDQTLQYVFARNHCISFTKSSIQRNQF